MQADHRSDLCEACKAGFCKENKEQLVSQLNAQKKYTFRDGELSDDEPFERVNERPKPMPKTIVERLPQQPPPQPKPRK